MPKLTETFVSKLPLAKEGTATHWDPEIKGRVLFVGKASKTWYFQKDVGGQTRRVMIGPPVPKHSTTDTDETLLRAS